MRIKNLLKLTFILSIVIAFNLHAFGQHQFGIKVSGGISRLYGALESRYHPPETIFTTAFSPSIQAGLYYKLPMGKKTAMGAELLYSQVEGGQTSKWYYMYIGVPYYALDFTYESISYFSLPVYFGYTFKRLMINGGVQISYAFSSSGSYEVSYLNRVLDKNVDFAIQEGGLNRELNELPIKDFDFGPRAGVIYRLTNHLSIEGMFYYGISNINQIKLSIEELKIQQMTVGIRYALWSDSEIR